MSKSYRFGTGARVDGSEMMVGGGIAYGNPLLLVTAMLLLGACQPPPGARWPADPAAAERGLAVIEKVQCAACHEIKGVDWPKGQTGPSLIGFSDLGPIAGSLPNRPDVLAAFVRNAPSVKPGSPMPPMPLSEAEARDVASYLYAASQ